MAESRRRRGASPRRRTQLAGKGRRRSEARGAKRGASPARPGAAGQATHSVADIVGQLHRHRQRATYAAVGALRGALAVRVRGWFAGREAPENSFVVSRISGEPTGYPPERVHPALKERAAVLESADALRAWLESHPVRHQDPTSRGRAPGSGGAAVDRKIGRAAR